MNNQQSYLILWQYAGLDEDTFVEEHKGFTQQDAVNDFVKDKGVGTVIVKSVAWNPTGNTARVLFDVAQFTSFVVQQ